MKNTVYIGFVIVALLLSGCTQEIDLNAEKEKVNTVLDKIIRMTETGDIGMLPELYIHSPEMVCFGTDASERVVGYEALESVMQEQFSATDQSDLTVRDRSIQVHSYGQSLCYSLDFEK